jgi:hypothetical protein
MNKVVLEPSTNTHAIESQNEIQTQDLKGGILKLKIKGAGIVTHGEHGTLVTESPDVIKYVQKELNPVTKALQNAFD